MHKGRNYITIALFFGLVLSSSAEWIEVSTEPDLLASVFSISTGDTIFVRNGDYYLTNTLNFAGGAEDIALIGESRDGVRLIGPGMDNPSYGTVPHIIMISDIERAYIANMTLEDVYYHPITVQSHLGAWAPIFDNLHIIDAGEQFIKVNSAEPPTAYCDSGVVRNCLFEFRHRARHWYTNGIDILATSGWLIEGNSFLRIRGPEGVLAGPAVLAWQNAINTTIRNNTFIECDIAISLGNSAGPGSIARNGESTYDNQNSIVVNNIIYRDGEGDVGITLNRARNALVAHNTVMLNETFPWNIEYRYSETTGTIANNLCDGMIFQRDGGLCSLSDNIDYAEGSWFLDPSLYDFHITAYCPAIDFCAPLPDLSFDIDGETRPNGTMSDAGADEYHYESFILEEKPEAIGIHAYPNPFNSNLFVDTEYPSQPAIFSLDGQRIWQAEAMGEHHKVQIPAASGQYILKTGQHSRKITLIR